MSTTLCILVALTFLPYFMSATALLLRRRQFGQIDNHYPRLQQAELRGVGARVHGAQANCWEALILFSVVVVIAHIAGLPLAKLDTVAIVFLGARLVYCAMYILDWAWARTGAFAAGILCCVYILYLVLTFGPKG